MSHEFRTPLNAILGYTHMLLQGVAGDLLPAVKRQLQRIDSNGRHLLTIINEILDITRIEAGKMPMQLSEFNLNELVPEVMAELDPVIARSKLTVTPRLSAEVPLVFSDRQKVKQIVVNLLSNALKFTHEGGIDIGVGVDPDEQHGDDRRGRHRHRHRAGEPREDLRGLPPGGRLALAPVRRHGPRSRHLPAPGQRARRPHHAAQSASARGRRSR